MTRHDAAHSATDDCLRCLNAGALRRVDTLPVVDQLEIILFQVIDEKSLSPAETAVKWRIQGLT